MSSPNGVGSDAPPTNATPGIQRLLFVADAAVADVDDLPPAVRAVIDAAAEVYVVTPTLPGASPGSPTMSIGSGTSPTSVSTRCWATCTRSARTPAAWRAAAASRWSSRTPSRSSSPTTS